MHALRAVLFELIGYYKNAVMIRSLLLFPFFLIFYTYFFVILTFNKIKVNENIATRALENFGGSCLVDPSLLPKYFYILAGSPEIHLYIISYSTYSLFSHAFQLPTFLQSLCMFCYTISQLIHDPI